MRCPLVNELETLPNGLSYKAWQRYSRANQTYDTPCVAFQFKAGDIMLRLHNVGKGWVFGLFVFSDRFVMCGTKPAWYTWPILKYWDLKRRFGKRRRVR